MDGISREELREIMREAIREELNSIRPTPKKDDDTLSFTQALDYLRSRNCVNSKSALYKMSDKVIPFRIVARRRVYYMRDLRYYADKVLSTA